MNAIRRRSNTRGKTLFTMQSASEAAGKPHTGQSRKATIFREMDFDSLVPTPAVDSLVEAPRVRNIVIFGDSGVGKSSLINMLAGSKIANTSSGVLGCTFESRQYKINIQGEAVNVWDTAGLDEGTRGRVAPETAEKNLTKLLRGLGGANGIHLLVYCIRGPSVRKSLRRNYTIFYSMICRKKVPIVAVVTGLENEPVSMDNWWNAGEKELAKYKMRFDDHACVTTIDMEKLVGSVFEDRSKVSQEVVRKLITDNCHRIAIRSPSDPNVFIKAVLHDFRLVMKAGWENMGPISTVVFYQTDVALFHTGIFGELGHISSRINGRSFIFRHTDNSSGRFHTLKLPKGGADLLIFSGKWLDHNVQKFQHFYTSFNGDVCPLLVVTNNDSIAGWKRHLDAWGISAPVEPFSQDGWTPAELGDLIDELCLVRASAKDSKGNFFKNIFRRGSKEAADDEASVLHDKVAHVEEYS